MVRGEYAWPFGDIEADMLDLDNIKGNKNDKGVAFGRFGNGGGGGATAADLEMCEEGYLGQHEYDKFGMNHSIAKDDLRHAFLTWMNEDFNQEYEAHVVQ